MLTPEDIEYLEDCECKGYHTAKDRRWFHAKVRAQAERIERLERVLAAEQGREGLEGWRHGFGSGRWFRPAGSGTVWRSWYRNGDDNRYGYGWEVHIGDERFEGTASTALEAMESAEAALAGGSQ